MYVCVCVLFLFLGEKAYSPLEQGKHKMCLEETKVTPKYESTQRMMNTCQTDTKVSLEAH